MILVDTSIWIDHLHKAEPALVDLLLAGEVSTHQLIIEELAVGTLKNREEFLKTMSGLGRGLVLSHSELLDFVKEQQLWGRGLSPTDAHLLGSAVLSEGATQLWARDKRLRQAAGSLGVAAGL